MHRDTIFRIASLTKPITAVAAMILVEDCKLRLDESIEAWLPELANRRVLKSMSSRRDEIFRSLGRFGWDDGLGTSAYADPAEEMIGVLFTQRMMASPEPPPSSRTP